MPSRLCIHYVSKSGRPSSGHRTGKGQSLSQIPKKGSTKEGAQHRTIVLIPRASKIMVKILHARLQHYMNQELPDVQAEFRNGKGTRDQIANIHQVIKKGREFQKNTSLCFINYAKAFDCGDRNELWKTLF